MKFTELTIEEFTKFVDKHPLKNFFQTKYMYDRYIKEKKKVFLVGVKENNKVVGASLLVKTSTFRGYDMYEALQGLILDYHNTELLKFFVQELKKFLSTKKVYKLIINPYIPLKKLDSEGNDTKEVDNSKIKKDILDLGFKELKEYEQVKWIYCLDIKGKTLEELFKSFKSNARNCINKTLHKFNLVIKELKYEELETFKNITSDTCKRKGFPDRSLTYYQNMYDSFKDQVKYLICYLDTDIYMNNLKLEKQELESKLEKISNAPANQKKRENIKQEITYNQKYLEEAKMLAKEKGKLIPLATAMFMLYGDEIIYLFSGSYDEYKNFFGQYRIQWEIISYAVSHNYQRYNFYGIKDITDKNNDENGVIKFKQNFNGYVEELLGAFALPINKMIYQVEHLYSRMVKKHSKK